jgi:hypothetical protein
MKVMVYTHSGTTAWWRYLASRLEFATATVVVGDLSDGDLDMTRDFHRNLRRTGIESEVLNAIGEPACDDVIARCRLLRALDRALALRMIGAMWRTIQDLLDRERPDVFLSFVIDRYILDLFDRALALRGVRYVGITIGPLPETFMFMARGEYLPVREPSEHEIDRAVAALSDPSFVTSYVTDYRFSLTRFLSTYMHFNARWLLFEALRWLRRRPYDFRYLWAGGQRVRLRDWGVTRYFRRDWRDVLESTPIDRRVFVGLSVNPEAAIEYWVRDRALVDYRGVLERMATELGHAGFRLFVKDHPSQFAFRDVEVFASLAKNRAVTFVPYDVRGQWLVSQCRATFTWTGTVGLQAAIAGRGAVVEANAYYMVPGLFLALAGPDDINDLARRIEMFVPSLPLPEARRTLAQHLLRSSVPGVYMSFQGFALNDADSVRRADTVASSLNRYMPVVVNRSPA